MEGGSRRFSQEVFKAFLMGLPEVAREKKKSAARKRQLLLRPRSVEATVVL